MQELGGGREELVRARPWSWAGLALWTEAGFTGHLDRPRSYSIATPGNQGWALVRVSQDSHLPSVFHAKKVTFRVTITF